MRQKVLRYAVFLMAAVFMLGGCGKQGAEEIAAEAEGTNETAEVRNEFAELSATPETPEEAAEPEAPAETEELTVDPELPPEPEILHFIDAWGEWHDAEVDPGVERHTYDWSCLTNQDGEISYTGDERYYIRKGIDVSQYQGNVNWEKVRAAGYDFVIIRLGFRGYGAEGKLGMDKQYRNNIIKANAAGLDVGVYIFAQAVNEEEALEEAEYVIQNLEGMDVRLPVVYDPELIRGRKARTDDVTGEQFTRNTIVFCERIKEAGYKPMIYSNIIWETFLFDLKELADYPIWYADYEAVPQTPYRFTFWQCTNEGRVDGINGDVDIDIWFCENN